MTFTDLEFAVFLPLVLALYWAARVKWAQNLVLLVAFNDHYDSSDEVDTVFPEFGLDPSEYDAMFNAEGGSALVDPAQSVKPSRNSPKNHIHCCPASTFSRKKPVLRPKVYR